MVDISSGTVGWPICGCGWKGRHGRAADQLMWMEAAARKGGRSAGMDGGGGTVGWPISCCVLSRRHGRLDDLRVWMEAAAR